MGYINIALRVCPAPPGPRPSRASRRGPHGSRGRGRQAIGIGIYAFGIYACVTRNVSARRRALLPRAPRGVLGRPRTSRGPTRAAGNSRGQGLAA